MADVNGEMFETVMKELEKVGKLNSAVKNISNSQKSLRADVEEVKEFVGYEDEAQTKNVVDSKKLPARLNTQERTRYENIGKQFTLGAGKEFQKIREKIKFSDKMSTAKDTFVKGFEKIKSKMKGVKKGSGLWSKIFKVVAILGLLGLIFKDKIAKAFPDTTNFFKDIIDKMKTSIGEILVGAYNYIKNCLGDSFVKVLKHLANVTIPKNVGFFFSHTLPNILLQSWLQILSMFSSSAGKRLEEMTGGKLVDFAEETVDDAEKGMNDRLRDEQDAQLRELRATNNLLKGLGDSNDFSKIDEQELRFYIQNSGMLAFDQMSKDFKDNLTSIARIALNDNSADLEKLIASGQFDITNFVEQAKGILESGANNQEELVQLFNDSMGKRVTAEQVRKRAAGLNSRASDDFLKQMEKLIQNQETLDKRGREVRDKMIAKREADQRAAKELMDEEARKVPPIQVNFSGAFDGAISEHLKTVLESINSFLSGDDSKMISYIRKGVVLLGAFYKSFIERSLGVVFETVKGVAEIYSGHNESKETLKFQQSITGGNNIILNVDLSESKVNGVGAALIVLSSTESQIVNAMKSTNEHLGQLKAVVSTINGLHAASEEFVKKEIGKIKVQNSTEALAELNERVNQQQKRLEGISDSLFGNRLMSDNNQSVPLTMMCFS